jgi:hypothetical protein
MVLIRTSYMVQHLLTKTELAFLSGSKQFTKPQARCIRCRLNKKLRTLIVELAELENNFYLRNLCAAKDESNASMEMKITTGRGFKSHPVHFFL